METITFSNQGASVRCGWIWTLYHCGWKLCMPLLFCVDICVLVVLYVWIQYILSLYMLLAMRKPWNFCIVVVIMYCERWCTVVTLALMSRNRSNYKSTSIKTIVGTIKFLHLSTYNPGSPRNHEGFQTNQPTSQDRTWFNTTHHLLQHFTSSLRQLTYIGVQISYYKPSLK
jgi:hypothetical protein